MKGEVLSLIFMATRIEKLLVKVLLIVFFLLGVGGYIFIREAEPKKIVMPSQAGTVIFDHVQHASEEVADLDCNMCHHRARPCGECHNSQKKGSEMSRFEAFHGNCGECHSEVEEEENCSMCHVVYASKPVLKPTGKKDSQAGPVIFDHTQHASEEAEDIDCDVCHHNASGEAANIDCDACHHTMPYETAKVKPCGKCHTMPGETVKVKPCGKCHNAQKNGSDISYSDAFHKNCGECHDEVQDSESCNMCHKSK